MLRRRPLQKLDLERLQPSGQNLARDAEPARGSAQVAVARRHCLEQSAALRAAKHGFEVPVATPSDRLRFGRRPDATQQPTVHASAS